MSNILLVPDVPGWIWDSQAQALKKYATDEFDVTICYQQDIQEQKANPRWLRQWDSIFHFSWINAPYVFGINRLVTLIAHDGLRWEYVHADDHAYRMNYMEQWAGATTERNLTHARTSINRADAVIAVNPELSSFATEKLAAHDCGYIPAGVDHEIFKPKTEPCAHGGKIRVGWCGQSGGRTKGWELIMEPLMQRMGDRVEWVVNRRSHQNALSQAEMVEWYNSIDVFLCTSISEGTPGPPLEAMACGRGVISTAVGDMPSVIGDCVGQCGVIVPRYTNQQQIVDTLDRLEEALFACTKENVVQMGRIARGRIADRYTWAELSYSWLKHIAGN